MDCRITDCRVVVREGSIISVPPDHFGIAGRQDRYYGIVKKIIQNDEKARVAWVEDNTTSIEDLGILQLETSMPETTAKSTTPREVPEVVINPPAKKKPVVGQKINKKKFDLRIQPFSEDSTEPRVEFDLCDAVGSTPNIGYAPGKRAMNSFLKKYILIISPKISSLFYIKRCYKYFLAKSLLQ